MRRSRKRRIDQGGAVNSAETDAVASPLLILIAVFAVVMTIINPKVPPVEPEESALYITSVWDTGLPYREDTNSSRQNKLESAGVPIQSGHSKADFDLWVAYIAPDGQRCELVGYPSSNRKSKLLKLDEDDRGWAGFDLKDDVNREVVGARSLRLPAGQYIVSVHLFSNSGETVSEEVPMMVNLKIEVNKDQPDRYVIEHQIPYTSNKMEYGVQFMVNEDGQVVESSVLAPTTELRIATARGGRSAVCSSGTVSGRPDR